jgi:hemerythrin-like domain-containing protein
MRPTEILAQEHRVIEQVLDCLERLADWCAMSGQLDGDSARQVVEFFRHFADHCHHGKEEEYLFPMLEAVGFVREAGPTGVMLDEHELGRLHLGGMAEAIDAAAAGDPDAVKVFLGRAWAYVDLLRRHIQKEDQVLFPMADHVLSAASQRALLESFDRVEAGHAGAHEKYLRLADELAARWGVERAELTAPACGGCGHHT